MNIYLIGKNIYNMYERELCAQTLEGYNSKLTYIAFIRVNLFI